MTPADKLEAALVRRGPMPECDVAREAGIRRQVATLELNGNPDRFVHNGLKARASRWGVRSSEEVCTAVQSFPTFTVDELAARWGDDLSMGRLFVRDFLSAGYLESADGNGRVRVTETGRWASSVWNGAGT